MARIRSIHPGLWTDESFMSVSPFARLLFMGIWGECDDNGVFEWKPLTLKMKVLPADNIAVPDLLAELSSFSLLKQFSENGKSVGAVRNFCKWQRPKAPQVVHPFPDAIATYVGQSLQDTDPKPERGTALGRMLADRQESLCFYCESEITFYRKKPNSLEIDHRVPVSRGGGDHVENLVATCRHCNSLKANMTDKEFREKFAPAELRERHASRIPNAISHPPKNVSHLPKTRSGEIRPQREEEGCRREEESYPGGENLDEVAEANGHAQPTGEESPQAQPNSVRALAAMRRPGP